MSDAAKAIIQECVIRRRIGGSAVQIGEAATVQIRSNEQPVRSSMSQAKKVNTGGDNKLLVAVSAFQGLEPTCTGTVTTPVGSCGYIMDNMYKTFSTERFGRARLPGLKVALPLTLRARE